MDDTWSHTFVKYIQLNNSCSSAMLLQSVIKKKSKNIPHQQHCVKTIDRRWKPFKSQVQYRTRLTYKNLSFFSDKAWFPLSRNLNCLTDTNGMDTPMMQFMKLLYMTFQLSVEYGECTHIRHIFLYHHLPFKGQAFGLFCLHTMPTSFLDVPHLFYLEIISEGDLRDL